MHELTIGRLAKHAGIGVETVRYYQRRGLMQLPPRPWSGARLYGVADLERLRYIRAAQRMGFTLTEIRGIIGSLERGDEPAVRSLMQKKLAFLEVRIRGLRHMQRELKSVLAPAAGEDILARLRRHISSATARAHERLAAVTGACHKHLRRRMGDD